MERVSGNSDVPVLWTWGTRVATWGAVSFAALVTAVALLDWRLPGGVGADAWMPAVVGAAGFAGVVAGAQRRWTCVSAALAVFALGALVSGTGTGAAEVSDLVELIEPASLTIR